MIRSFARLSAVDLGFNPDGVITMEVLSLEKDPTAQTAYYPALLQQLRTIPGIASVGLVDNFVLGSATAYTSASVAGQQTGVTAFAVLPGYFETIGARLRDGRLPANGDYASGLRGVVISESAARSMFPGRQAVGQSFTMRGQEARPWTVLGVVADLKHTGPLNVEQRRSLQVFLPLEDWSPFLARAMVVVLRPSSPIPELAARLRQVAQSVGSRALVERVRTADDWFGERVVTPRRRLVLLSLLGGLGLTLVVVGVFGLTAYSVARRTSEIGVRIAFGARPGDVVLRMVRDAALPVLCGLGAGALGAYYSARVVESFLFETTPHDPATFAAVTALVGLSAILAALIPARKAAHVDPVVALRAE
jgi:ABC-type antimicrobial peptide transport system permease subunit